MIPYTEGERLALLDELERGEKVILPVSEDHARFMIRVAEFYLEQQRQKTWNSLKSCVND